MSFIKRRFKAIGGPYDIVERWAETFNEGEPSAVAALYALGATIWGTLAQSLTTSPDDIETYFIQAARTQEGGPAAAPLYHSGLLF